jgi:hypothetical protein
VKKVLRKAPELPKRDPTNASLIGLDDPPLHQCPECLALATNVSFRRWGSGFPVHRMTFSCGAQYQCASGYTWQWTTKCPTLPSEMRYKSDRAEALKILRRTIKGLRVSTIIKNEIRKAICDDRPFGR